MDIYKLKFTTLQLEIFRLLCMKAGEKLNQREVSTFLSVSPTAIAKAVPTLEKAQLITRERQKNLNLIFLSLNRNNQKAMQLKRIENLKMLYESGLPDFLEEEFPGTTIILFGSYGRGDDMSTSDIDIAIVGRKEKELQFEKFNKLLEREIRINYYESFNKIHKALKENICNGIVLVGGIEV